MTVAIFLAPAGTGEVEFTEPKRAVSDDGATVDVVGIETGEARTGNDDLEEIDAYEVEKRIDEVSADEYDAVIVPGATAGADALRADDDAVDFPREHGESGKPTGVICHGP